MNQICALSEEIKVCESTILDINYRGDDWFWIGTVSKGMQNVLIKNRREAVK